MQVIKLENITWSEHPAGAKLPDEAIIEISEKEYFEELTQSTLQNILESYTNAKVANFTMRVVMVNGPVLRYRKPREGELVFSGPLW